ncbi:hypothetical protein [Aestuariimicrobium ganziense]|uniref:hypothetical protein n=1 Tax=Aestuariimicrobium ganziense TaxID=2773677 RepID=UPI001943DE62|nr:hypothetical protein [Aestuariimicrobium ganziense]
MNQVSPSSQPTPVRVPAEPLVLRAEPAPVAANQQVWWDDRRPSPSWNAPDWTDTISRRTKLLVALAVAMALVLGVWLAGGLKDGGVTFRAIPRNTTITSGPFELTFQSAEWEYTDWINKGAGGYRIKLYGTCRNIDDTSRRNLLLDLADAVVLGGFNNGTVEVGTEKRVQVGQWDDRGLRREELAPGLPALPCTFFADMPEGFKPQALAVVGVYDLVWNDSDDVQSGGQRWMRRDSGVRTQVPAVEVTDGQ